MGTEGDGVAFLPGTAGRRGDGDEAGRRDRIHVPFTLPGELVQGRIAGTRGEATRIVEASADRVTPPCPHFGGADACGGCTLQHWRDDAYVAWKSGLLLDALRRAGFAEPPLGPAACTPPGARRRMDLALRRAAGGAVRIGLHRRGSADIVDLAACPILHPALFALLGPLRTELAPLSLLRREGSAVVNLLDSGPDLLLRTDAPPTPADRAALTRFARSRGVPRIAWARSAHAGGRASGQAGPAPAEAEPICVLRPASITFAGGMAVEPAPGAFLQSSAEGEAAIVAAVLAGLPERLPRRARIVELYAGNGTLTAALAERARVLAVEGNADAVAALRRGAAGRRIEAVQRDLARQPITAKELAGAAAIVLDPPHAGATGGMPAIAASGAGRVIYVSCNPAALARDAHALREAGYGVHSAKLVDQFLWSARVESVVVFTR